MQVLRNQLFLAFEILDDLFVRSQLTDFGYELLFILQKIIIECKFEISQRITQEKIFKIVTSLNQKHKQLYFLLFSLLFISHQLFQEKKFVLILFFPWMYNLEKNPKRNNRLQKKIMSPIRILKESFKICESKEQMKFQSYQYPLVAFTYCQLSFCQKKIALLKKTNNIMGLLIAHSAVQLDYQYLSFFTIYIIYQLTTQRKIIFVHIICLPIITTISITIIIKFNMQILLIVGLLIFASISSPASDLDVALAKIQNSQSLMGIQLQITNRTHPIYNANIGFRDGSNPITNDTMFRVASISKSLSSASLMILVENGKLNLTQSLSDLLGFQVKNPYFPDSPITLEMVLSHQSSIAECQPYYTNFLTDTYQAKTGVQIPLLKEMLGKGGKYYNDCHFSKTFAPGTHFTYANINFGIAGTVVQRISKVRFDIFVRQNILKHISNGLSEIATFNAGTISDPLHLGTIFKGQGGKWVPNYDSYPSGVIPQRNLTGYEIGSNGVIFGPQGGLRASVSHLSNYIQMLSNDGKTKDGTRILQSSSVQQMLKPIYQYHGKQSGSVNDFHLYGLGLYTTTYRINDMVIPHSTVRGHTGSAYGLISAYYFWGNYTLTYIINGALNGYTYGTGTIYEKERLLVHEAVYNFTRGSL